MDICSCYLQSLPDASTGPESLTMCSVLNMEMRCCLCGQAIEALLAGSIRRERAAEEAMTQQAAEIEQLNRLV